MFSRTLLALSLATIISSVYANSLVDQPLQLSTPEEPLNFAETVPNAIPEIPKESKADTPKVPATKTTKDKKTLETEVTPTSPVPVEETKPVEPKSKTTKTEEPKKATSSNDLSLANLNNAQWSANPNTATLAKAQVMLDNAYAPAGAIDGSSGQKTDKAIRSFQIIYGLPKTGKLDQATWDKLNELNHSQDVFIEYTISTADTDKKLYVSSMPSDYGEKAKMKHLGYTRVSEMLGEKFHLDEAFLKRLNPNAKFVAGEQIIVANVHNTLPTDIALIVAHKTAKQLYLFNSKNQMVGSFPATFGNDPKALVGEHTITGVARNPWYSYSPSNFVQGNNLKPLSLPPGPNGPVGNIWIGLSKKSFGIHGTPDPSKISTNNSHGCIRLSNWDANNLGHYVKKGVKVRFVD